MRRTRGRAARNSATALVGAIAVVAACPSGAAAAAATPLRFELNVFGHVPCALDGAGEDVLFQGWANLLVVQNTDANGGTHFVLHDNYSQMRGTGQTSGTRYRAVEASTTSAHNVEPSVGPPYSITSTQTVRLIGQGTASDLITKTTRHVTVNANGVVTGGQDNFTVICD